MIIHAFVSTFNWFWSMDFTMVNILIVPVASDFGRLEGLCGNYNGDWLDDLQARDGTIQSPFPYSRSDTYDAFTGSWE